MIEFPREMTMDEAWKVAVPNAREDLMKRRRRKLKNRVSGLEALVISIFNPHVEYYRGHSLWPPAAERPVALPP